MYILSLHPGSLKTYFVFEMSDLECPDYSIESYLEIIQEFGSPKNAQPEA